MANYLERVASSAARKAAVARPPSSGPPLLPAGRDFAPPSQETFAATEDEVFPGGIIEPDTRERSRSMESTAEAQRATPTAGSSLHVEPRAAPPPVSLKNESPFTVHLPKTLRPLAQDKIPPPVGDEPPPPTRIVATEPSTTNEEALSVLQSSGTDDKETVEGQRRPTTRTTPRSPDRKTDREPVVKEIIETSEPRPAEVHERESTPNKIPTFTPRLSNPPRDDETLPVAVPKQTPAVVVGGTTSRPEPSRISIGQFEVMVNNHPVVEPAKPAAAAPTQSNHTNLERRYLDRFRLRR